MDKVDIQTQRDRFEENRRIARGNAAPLNKAMDDVVVPVIRALFDLVAGQQRQIEALTAKLAEADKGEEASS